MELLNYIKYILIENNYVILPELGGFITHYNSAKIHEGNFTPPYKSFIFDKNLNYNDNRLIEYIIKKEGINRTEASNKVSRTIKNIIYRLVEGDKIEIPDIGFLQYDKNGTICFTENIKKGFNISSLGMPSFKFKPSNNKEKGIEETKKKYWFLQKSHNKKDNTTKNQNPESEINSENNNTYINTSVKKEGKIFTKESLPNKENNTIKNSIPMNDDIQEKGTNLKNENPSVEKSVGEQKIVEEKNTPPTIKQVRKKNNESKGMMILKIILVIAVTVVIIMIIIKELDNNNNNNNIPLKENTVIPAQHVPTVQPNDSLTNKKKTEKQIVVNKDTISSISEKNKNQNTLKNKETNSTSNDSYFIIGGVFKSQSHAIKYIDEMKAKGYTNIKDIPFSKNLHYVSIDSFSTLEDAKAAKKKILTEDPKSGVWIYKKH